MLSDWRKYRYLWWGALILIVFFMVATAADAAICQKITKESGNCLLPCLCCHGLGAFNGTPIPHTRVEYVTSYIQVPVAMAPVILVYPFFHPPRS